MCLHLHGCQILLLIYFIQFIQLFLYILHIYGFIEES